MAVQHISRTRKKYYLHAKATRTGKTGYFFSLSPEGEPVERIPEGFEVYENAGGQVFLRRTGKQIIRPDELALVEDALQRRGEAWRYRAETRKNAITVYEADDMHGLEQLVLELQGRKLTEEERLRHAQYVAVMRFVLKDRKARGFVTERFCFKGHIDDWIYLDGPADLVGQVAKYARHLGRDSFFELYRGA